MVDPIDFSIAAESILHRAASTASEDAQGFPHYADMSTGTWTRSHEGDWTGGFFVGQLWLGAAAGHEELAAIASTWSEKLRPRVRSETIFRGFLFWYGAALGAELLGDTQAGTLAMEGAKALASSFQPIAGLLPLGPSAEESHSVGEHETNIDGVPGGAPLLYWAAKVTGNEGLRDVARSHVARHVELLVRDDGSVVQSASLDPATGRMTRTYTHKGVTDTSTWARAQAWAMLGLAQAARYEPDQFARPAMRVCDWWCENLPPSNVSLWDFDAAEHEDEPLVDTSATAIAAAALLKMRDVAGAERFNRYQGTAHKMVEALVRSHLSGPGMSTPAGILGDGCYNHRIGLAKHHELVWGTYYLLECLLGLAGKLDTSLL